MNSFTFESQGVNTYLVYEIQNNDVIDTLSLGMITNNKIKGVIPVIYTQMDDAKYVKYNVSSKISLRQYFEGTVTKNRFLTVFLSIAMGILEAEEYMIDTSSFVLDLDYIFVDVSTSEANIVCLPIIYENQHVNNLAEFYKNLVFSTQFDPTENCDYVAKIISLLNSTGTFSLIDFKGMIEKILFQNSNTNINMNTVSASNNYIDIQKNNINVIPVAQQVLPPVKEVMPITTPPVIESKPIIKQPAPIKKPAINNNDMRNTKNSGNKMIPIQDNKVVTNSVGKRIAIPGMVQEEVAITAVVEEQKKPSKKSWLFGKKAKDETKKVDKANKANKDTPVVPNQSMLNNIQYQQSSVPYNQPIIPNNMVYTQTPQAGFGETTVLGSGASGETTVLGNNNTTVNTVNPYLIRIKNQEKIPLNKAVLRIGKERSYVDYFIGDNPSISRSHANIITHDGQFFIVDTNSTNHTFIDGMMIQSNMEVMLHHGCRILLANEEFEFLEY